MNKNTSPSSSAAMPSMNLEKSSSGINNKLPEVSIKRLFAGSLAHIKAIAKVTKYIVKSLFDLMFELLASSYSIGAGKTRKHEEIIGVLCITGPVFLVVMALLFAVSKDPKLILVIKFLLPTLYLPATYMLGAFSKSDTAKEIKAIYTKELDALDSREE